MPASDGYVTSDSSPCSAWAEFVEQRARIVKRQQRRLVCWPFGEVQYVDDNGLAAIVELVLTSKGAHPRAGTLGWPRKIVSVEQADGLALRIAHFKNAHVQVIYRHILAFPEGNPEQLRGGVKSRLDHAIERQVRLDFRLVQIKLGSADFFRRSSASPRARW